MGRWVWMGVCCPCPPVRNDILTPRHLFYLSNHERRTRSFPLPTRTLVLALRFIITSRNRHPYTLHNHPIVVDETRLGYEQFGVISSGCDITTDIPRNDVFRANLRLIHRGESSHATIERAIFDRTVRPRAVHGNAVSGDRVDKNASERNLRFLRSEDHDTAGHSVLSHIS